MNEKELYNFWKKHIDSAKLYRVFSEEYKPIIQKEGFNPKNNPYKDKYIEIKKLFNLLLWLEKKHTFNHRQDWGKTELVNSEYIVNCSLNDMKRKFIDFTPYLKEVAFYQTLMKGNNGALVSTVQKITRDIIDRKPKLPFSFKQKIITDLHDWTITKGSFDVAVLYVKGSARCFETAIFQDKLGSESNLTSPFGSFKHFKKVINEFGLGKYKPFFEENTWFNVRVTTKIHSRDINFI